MARLRAVTTRLVSARRAQAALLANASVSLASLVVSVAVARRSDVHEFGQFAVMMLCYALVVGGIRAGVVDTALAKADDRAAADRSARRAGCLALAAAVVLLLVASLTGNVHLAVLAVAVHGLVVLDYLRTTDAALHDSRAAVAQSAAWSAVAIAVAGLSIVWPAVPPVVVTAAWAGGGAVVGYVHAVRRGLVLRPGWPRQQREETRAAAFFALDFAAGSGGSALTTLLLGGVLSPTAVGAIRGAGTLLGPANVLSTTARSLMIPRLVRSGRAGPAAELRVAVRLAVLLAGVAGVLAAGVLLVPASVGEALLGATWPTARAVLPALAVESLLAFVGSIPSAGHRAAMAGARALTLRLLTGVPRPFVVLAAGLTGGAVGAVWAMAAIAAVNAVVWWASYVVLLRRRGPAAVSGQARP